MLSVLRSVGDCSAKRSSAVVGQRWIPQREEHIIHTIGSARPLPVPEINWYPTSLAVLVDVDIVVKRPEPIEFSAPPATMKGR